jgi:hypothetical protein
MALGRAEIVSIIAAGIACIGAIASATLPANYSFTNRNRELDIKLVEIGISILRADPKETQTSGARDWAIKVIESYSHQSFSPEAKAQLLDNKLGYTYSDTGYDLGSYTRGNFSSSGPGDPGKPSQLRSPSGGGK